MTVSAKNATPINPPNRETLIPRFLAVQRQKEKKGRMRLCAEEFESLDLESLLNLSLLI